MKTTKHYKGHRWTTDELKRLMQMWQAGSSLEEIGEVIHSTEYALLKMIQKMRAQGVPLKRRDRGRKRAIGQDRNAAVVPGKNYGRLWTQADLEFVVRRRKENATAEEIAIELGRSVGGVNGIIQRLRAELVPVPMRGMGVRRLWNPSELRAKFIEDDQINGIVQ
jgi:biotin operon repressor